MHTNLPIISSTGIFHSSDKFSDPVKYPDGSVTRIRTVVDYELELYTEDGGQVHTNGVTHSIHKGDLMLAEPGDKRQSTLPFTTAFVHFGTSDPAVRDLLHSMAGYHPSVDFDALMPDLNDIFETSLQFEPDSALLASAKLIAFLCRAKKYCTIHSAAGLHGSSYSVISSAIEFMKKNYMEPLTVASIAEHCCLSTSYFHRIFVATAHITPNEYLIQIRLAAAKMLLSTTSLPISSVAFQCGFNSQTYFSDCFKRGLNMTPREFRQSYMHPDTLPRD